MESAVYTPRFTIADWEDEARYDRRLKAHHGKPWGGSKSTTRKRQTMGLQDLLNDAKIDRPTHFFTVPAQLAQAHGVTELGLVELTAEEELNATKRAHNDPIRLAWELAKESLRVVDGKALSAADGSLDKVWNRMHAKIRTLVMTAYSQLHQPGEQATAGFLASRQIKVG